MATEVHRSVESAVAKATSIWTTPEMFIHVSLEVIGLAKHFTTQLAHVCSGRFEMNASFVLIANICLFKRTVTESAIVIVRISGSVRYGTVVSL